jgi:hypothetical protein
MTKPIQLRCLIGLLGFEPNVAQLYNDEHFDAAMLQFLDSLDGERTEGKKEDEWDKWIIIMSGIIRGKLFRNDAVKSNKLSDLPGEEADNRGRNKQTDAIMKKAVEGIIQTIMETSQDAADFRNEAEVALTKTDPTEEDEQRMEKLLDSYHIGTDIKPDFVPWCYRLCSGKVIHEAIPELDERCDFIVNEDADVLKVDERMDRKKAEDEKREDEQKQRMKTLAEERQLKMDAAASNTAANGSGPGLAGTLDAAKRRGVAGSAGRGMLRPSTGSDTAASLMQSKGNTGTKPNASVSSRLGTSTAAGGRARMAGLGRGAAADAIGGKSLANPMSRIRKPGARAALLSSKRPGAGQGVASSTIVNTGRAAMRNKTRMKVIDVAEVEGLKKEGEERNKRLSAEEIRENKRRKIMEKAASKGLKSKKLGTDTNGSTEKNTNPSATTASDAIPNSSTMEISNDGDNGTGYNGIGVHPLDQHDIPLLEASIFQDQRSNNGLHVSELDWNMDQNHGQDQLQQHTAQQINTVPPNSHNHAPHQQVKIPQEHQPPAKTPQWQSLLERSNKLTDEDRLRVEQFFTSRYNPTPDMPVYKMKLNEERSIDPQTGQFIKETLYIELDYQTGGYKMSRKIKKKSEE